MKKISKKKLMTFVKQNCELPYFLIYEDLEIFNIMNTDLKLLLQNNKHLDEDTYSQIFKYIYLTDERITSMISGNEYNYIYKSITLPDIAFVINDITGISKQKIKKLLINSEYFEIIHGIHSGKSILIKAKMDEKEKVDFNVHLLEKYEIYKETLKRAMEAENDDKK